jgi:hypothetical protein
LAALGLIAIAAVALLPVLRENPFARWMLIETLAPERVLPLIGLGAACALTGARAAIAALALFALGIAGGYFGQDWLLSVLYNVPEGPTHLFLTGPISCLVVGLALVPGLRLLPWLLPVAALVAGAMLALAIMLTDPSLHEPAYTWTPVLIAFWMVGAIALTLRAFQRGWFAIFGRILGSWLVAIGLLYGGAAVVPKRQPPPPAVALPPASAPAPGRERAIPGLPVPDQPAPFPGGADRFRQP